MQYQHTLANPRIRGAEWPIQYNTEGRFYSYTQWKIRYRCPRAPRARTPSYQAKCRIRIWTDFQVFDPLGRVQNGRKFGNWRVYRVRKTGQNLITGGGQVQVQT